MTTNHYIYLVYCKDCDDFTKWENLEEAENQRWRHYWKQHDNMDNIVITEYAKIREIDSRE